MRTDEKAGGFAIGSTSWRWVRRGLGAGILVLLVVHLGAGPFLAGLRATSPGCLAAALVITALTTVCCAWRWSLVAESLGAPVPVRRAFAACYRSQLINATLPGGVLGDVHRGLSHGHDLGDVGRGLRSVVWERTLGQVVQVALTLVVLLVLPSPVDGHVLVTVVTGGVALLGVAVVVGSRDVRRIVRTRRWTAIAVASIGASTGHAAIFLIAVRTTGGAMSTVSTLRLLPLALVVLLASSIPANLAGWGPREGAAAWAFGAAGLGAAEGVTAAVVYGVMALVATIPGAVVLIADWHQRDTESRQEPTALVRRATERSHV